MMDMIKGAVKKIAGKKVQFVMLVLVVLCLLVGTTVYAVAEKNKSLDYVPVEMMDYNGQSYTIDDYTFTLEYSLYDSRTGIGYCVFVTKREAGKIDITTNRWHQLLEGGFGEDHRFYFSVDASCAITYEKKGDVIYTYMKFTHNRDDGEFGVHLWDRSVKVISSDDEVECASYDFTLTDTNHIAEYTIDETTTLYVSPLGWSLFSNSALSNLYVRIEVKDGKDIILDEANEIGLESSGSRIAFDEAAGTQSWQYTKVFDTPLDLNNIENIQVTGS